MGKKHPREATTQKHCESKIEITESKLTILKGVLLLSSELIHDHFSKETADKVIAFLSDLSFDTSTFEITDETNQEVGDFITQFLSDCTQLQADVFNTELAFQNQQKAVYQELLNIASQFSDICSIVMQSTYLSDLDIRALFYPFIRALDRDGKILGGLSLFIDPDIRQLSQKLIY